MQNQGCSGGCLSFIAGLVIIGLCLLAIKWFGVPVGAALVVIGFLQFKRFETDPEGFDRTAKSLGMQIEHFRWATIGAMVLGAILVIASIILWSVPNDDQRGAGSAIGGADEMHMINICSDAISGPTDDAYGAGAAMNGDYVSSDVTPHADGTSTVSIVNRREASGMSCPAKLVGSCVMRGTSIVSKSKLHQDGYFAC